MRTALLLVDIQNDYFPGGAMELAGSTEAAEQARKLPVQRARRHGIPLPNIINV